jgi:prepilin-type processing-associated H-X9-DG protein
MTFAMRARPYRKPPKSGLTGAFTLLELVILTALIAILSSILLSALSNAKTRAHAIFCLNNTRQLIGAWHMYAGDNDGRLAYNLDTDVSTMHMASVTPGVPQPAPINWVNNVETWDLSSDNTNTSTITKGCLGSYSSSPQIYRCPADTALSAQQKFAGWDHRIRSYSMNGMVGDAGTVSTSGVNVENPDSVQFFKEDLIEQPSEIFVFLDEHPDSIKGGYFMNKDSTPLTWSSLPASYHNGAASFAFADGHAELHRWVNTSTRKPAVAGGAGLPFVVPQNQSADFNWMFYHMSEDQGN